MKIRFIITKNRGTIIKIIKNGKNPNFPQLAWITCSARHQSSRRGDLPTVHFAKFCENSHEWKWEKLYPEFANEFDSALTIKHATYCFTSSDEGLRRLTTLGIVVSLLTNGCCLPRIRGEGCPPITSGPKIEHFWALFNFSVFVFASLCLAYL